MNVCTGNKGFWYSYQRDLTQAVPMVRRSSGEMPPPPCIPPQLRLDRNNKSRPLVHGHVCLVILRFHHPTPSPSLPAPCRVSDCTIPCVRNPTPCTRQEGNPSQALGPAWGEFDEKEGHNPGKAPPQCKTKSSTQSRS